MSHTIMYFVLGVYAVILIYYLVLSIDSTKDFGTYALSNRDYPPFVIAIVMAVTMVGPADALALSQNGFDYGALWALFPIGAALAQFVSSKYFVNPLNSNFKGLTTVGDIFKRQSGHSSAIAVGFITFLQAVAFSGVLILAGGQVLERFLGIDQLIGMILTALTVSIYTSAGGMLAVMKTDKIQASLMGLMLLGTLIVCIIYSLQDPTLFAKSIVKPSFYSEYSIKLILAMFLGYFLGEIMLPTYCIRAMISSDGVSASKGFYYASLGLAVWYLVITYSGSIAQYIYPENYMLSHDKDLILLDVLGSFFLKHSLYYNVIAAFVFIVFLSLIHSTFDSFLNTGAISFSRDFLGGITNLTEEQELWLSKQMTLAISMFGLAIAMWKHDLIDVLFIGYTVWVPSLLFPLVWIIKNPDKKLSINAFWTAFLSGSLAWWIFEYKIETSYVPSILIGLIVNAFALLIVQKIYSKPTV